MSPMSMMLFREASNHGLWSSAKELMERPSLLLPITFEEEAKTCLGPALLTRKVN